jgi:very-short-patch-repair endonuclease
LPALTKPEATFKQILEEMGFTVKFFEDKSPKDVENIYMQVPVLSYCLDFACPQKKVAIEVDGEYWHGSASMLVTASQLQRKMHDTQRDAELENDGWTVFRIPASSLGNERLKPRLIKYVQELFKIE